MEKRINGYENYSITDDGKVISYNSYSHKEPRQLSSWICNSGYETVGLCKNNNVKNKMIHRLVAEHFVDGWFDGAVVNHIDGNKLNNNASNLEWVTISENTRHGYTITGVDQFRHYNWWIIIHPDGSKSEKLKGCSSIKKYIEENNLDCKYYQLYRNKHSRGYSLIKVE